MASLGGPSSGGRPGEVDGPPYAPTTQALGETPKVLPDIPVNAVFLFLFIGAAIGHMGLFKYNQNKLGKKFVFNAMIFGFCMTRIFATSIRIAWSVYPRNISVGIAAQIFVYAGIILLFIANLFFSQRIVRAQHPHIGWSKPFSVFIPILCAIIIATILCLIAAVIVQFYAINGEAPALDIQKFGSTLFAVVAFLPIPIVAVSSLARQHKPIKMTKPLDKFGSGSMRAKIAIVIISAFFLTLGAAFRAATTLIEPIALLTDGNPPRPAPQPWFLSKAAFYTFNFTIEICVTLAWLALRIDQRFYIPDGARGPGSYAGGFIFAGEAGNEKHRSTRHLTSASARSSMHNGSRISLASSRAKSIESRISWGGVSRENISPMYGEDGIQIMPYEAFAHEHYPHPQHQHDGRGGEEEWWEDDEADLGGMEKEMGWDPKSGKWALRPISRARRESGHSSTMMSPAAQSSAHTRESSVMQWNVPTMTGSAVGSGVPTMTTSSSAVGSAVPSPPREPEEAYMAGGGGGGSGSGSGSGSVNERIRYE